VEDLPTWERIVEYLTLKMQGQKWFSKSNNQMGIMVFYCIVLHCIVGYGRWLVILTPK